jgi:hypothetical protein
MVPFPDGYNFMGQMQNSGDRRAGHGSRQRGAGIVAPQQTTFKVLRMLARRTI